MGDDYSAFFGMSKSQTKTLSIGTWNIRGLRNKVNEVEKALVKKGVNICAFQETKADASDIVDEPTEYNVICFNWKEKAYGSAFVVKKNLIVEESTRE